MLPTSSFEKLFFSFGSSNQKISHYNSVYNNIRSKDIHYSILMEFIMFVHLLIVKKINKSITNQKQRFYIYYFYRRILPIISCINKMFYIKYKYLFLTDRFHDKKCLCIKMNQRD